jgi:hypothetical protein
VTEGARKPGRRMGRVSHRAPWLAWSLCSCVLLLLALSASLIFLGWSTPLPPKQDPWWQQLARIVTFSGAPLLGGFIASRRPENAYGWVWLAFGFGLALLGFSQAYVSYALVVENGALPAPRTVDSVVGGMGWGATITFIPILLLLFPTGRYPAYLCGIHRVTDGARTRDLQSHNPPTSGCHGLLGIA